METEQAVILSKEAIKATRSLSHHQNTELPHVSSASQKDIEELMKKHDYLTAALEAVKTSNGRALTLFTMLVEINILLANFERQSKEAGIDLVEHPYYLKWMQLKFDILRHFERMKLDFAKLEASVAKKIENDTIISFE